MNGGGVSGVFVKGSKVNPVVESIKRLKQRRQEMKSGGGNLPGRSEDEIYQGERWA